MEISDGLNKKYLYVGLGIATVVIIGLVLLSKNRLPDSLGGEYSSLDIAGLTATVPTETVELKNGDSYDLTAGYVEKTINGRQYRMLAYNGMIPGPLIKVAQGSEISINFQNNTDIKTLLHSHGVRMDNSFDGSQATQKEMAPGESFEYKLKFPDAGMYWYHPHVREDYAQELGLYGNFLVVPSDENHWSPVNREVPLFLDDVLIENGQINLSRANADHTLMGRYGNVMLINGETDYTFEVKNGELIRFYITNAANARPFNFAIAGARMKLVGADSGAYEREEWRDIILISPSERAIVEVLFDKPGNYAFQNQTPDKTYTLGSIMVSNEEGVESYATQFETLRLNEEIAASIDSFRALFTQAPDKRIALSIDMTGEMMSMMGGHMMPDGTMMGGMMMENSSDGIEWEDDMQMMNLVSDADMVQWHIEDQDTGKKDMDIDWSFKRGQPVKIRIFNDPNSAHPMQHPIHFHGQRFLVVSRDDVPQTNLAWKDTVLVTAGETVDIVLDTTNPGTWMAHCHIAEHLEAGMMFTFEVQ